MIEITEHDTDTHVWSFELWAPHQLDRPAGMLPMQVPDKTGRFEAPDGKAARAHAQELAAGRGAGWMAGAGQHFRYSCCRTWAVTA